MFMKPILEDMQRINQNFQSNDSNSTKLLGDLILSINCLKSKIIPSGIQIDVFEEDFMEFIQRDLYLGYEFESNLKRLKSKIDDSTEQKMRYTCTDFVIELINQLKQRYVI